MLNKRDIIIVLHNVRSVYNVGAIFRTADAIGASKVILSGITPGPLDRFSRLRKDFAKTALGAEKLTSERTKNIMSTLRALKKDNFTIIALEDAPQVIDYKTLSLKRKNHVVLILGAERGGVPKKIINLADCVICIPMRGRKESLNVSVAAGIALFRLFDV